MKNMSISFIIGGGAHNLVHGTYKCVK